MVGTEYFLSMQLLHILLEKTGTLRKHRDFASTVWKLQTSKPNIYIIKKDIEYSVCHSETTQKIRTNYKQQLSVYFDSS